MISITINTEQAEDWARKAKGQLKEFVVEALQDMNEVVVDNTPWITGFLRASWWSSVGGEGSSPGGLDPGGSATVARMNMTLVDLELGDIYVAQNGANYAAFVEYGTKYMAPRAYVGRAVARFQEIADAAAARVAARYT